jgi:hypothetical protein
MSWWLCFCVLLLSLAPHVEVQIGSCAVGCVSPAALSLDLSQHPPIRNVISPTNTGGLKFAHPGYHILIFGIQYDKTSTESQELYNFLLQNYKIQFSYSSGSGCGAGLQIKLAQTLPYCDTSMQTIPCQKIITSFPAPWYSTNPVLGAERIYVFKWFVYIDATCTYNKCNSAPVTLTSYWFHCKDLSGYMIQCRLFNGDFTQIGIYPTGSSPRIDDIMGMKKIYQKTSCTCPPVRNSTQCEGLCRAPAGYAVTSSGANLAPCGANSYNNGSAKACTTCPWPQTFTAGTGLISVAQCACRPGYERLAGVCTACVIHLFFVRVHRQASSCNFCAPSLHCTSV